MNKLRFIILIFFSSILSFFACRPDSYALTADELLIVANSAVPESVDLARYYMLKRNVPQNNLLVVRTSAKEQIERNDYDRQIARPVGKFLEENDPEGKRFKCITLMYGMPLRVLPPSLNLFESIDLRKLQTSLKEGTDRERLIGSQQTEESKKLKGQLVELRQKIQHLSRALWGASVDSELALVREKSYELNGWQPNKYFIFFHDKKINNMPQQAILVCRLDGPTPSIVRRIVDDSLYRRRAGTSGKSLFRCPMARKRPAGKKQKIVGLSTVRPRDP